MQPREYGPLTADKTSYGSYGSDRVFSRGHASVDGGPDLLRPLGESLDEVHAYEPTARTTPGRRVRVDLWTANALWTPEHRTVGALATMRPVVGP